MKNKLLEILKKYKIAIIIAIGILLIGLIILLSILYLSNNSHIRKINSNYYSLDYDNTWKITKKREDIIILKHNSGGKVSIQINKLTDEYKYSTIDELIDELLYNIKKQNNNYKLLSKKHDKITKYKFDGYKILYEDNKKQVMLYTYKKSDKLITIIYEAKNNYFDILLDSVQNIVYNLNVKDKEFDIKGNLTLNISNVKYEENKEVDKLLNKSEKYEIANNNYYVVYSIPSSFKQKSLDSSTSNFELESKSGRISMNVNIFNSNIYEYLEQDATVGLYNKYKTYQKDKDYSGFKEMLTKLDSDYDSYIYKNSYYYDKAIAYDKDLGVKNYKRKEENVELIYALNNSHILIIDMKASGIPITKKLVEMIKINSSKNYASYVKITKENNFLIGILQRFTDYNYDKIDYIKLKIPDKYEEIDKNRNINLERNYSLNYNEDMLIYDYDVRYELTTLQEKSIIDNINSTYIKSSYGDSHELSYSGNLTLNNKLFKSYDGGYTDLSGIMFTNINRKKYYVAKKVLVYEIPERGNLYIEISGNGKEIDNEILNELTNFTMEIKNIEKKEVRK